MSEIPDPKIDPDAAQPTRVTGPARRKVGPAKVFLAFLLAVAITAVAAGILSVVVWAFASVFH